MGIKKSSTFAAAFEKSKQGTLAQVVEQWTENPCVLGSTPRGTTRQCKRFCTKKEEFAFYYLRRVTYFKTGHYEKKTLVIVSIVRLNNDAAF